MHYALCSVYVMMNKRTRKISKFIKETREETKDVFMEITDPVINHDDAKQLRALDVDTADNVQTGLLVCFNSAFLCINSRPCWLFSKLCSVLD